MQYKTLNSFKVDLEICYRAAIKEYKTQNLVCKLNFYPNIKQTDSIKQRNKEIEIRIESLRQRLKTQKTKEDSKSNEVSVEESNLELMSNKIINKFDKSIENLRLEEQKLINKISSLNDLESEIHAHNLEVMNKCQSIVELEDHLSFSNNEIKNSFEIILNKGIYGRVPCVTTVSDVIQLDGKIIEGSKAFRILLSLLYKYRHSEKKDSGLDHTYDSLTKAFSQSYLNMISTCVFHSIRKTNEALADNYPIARMLSFSE
jgi:hypothetical protein